MCRRHSDLCASLRAGLRQSGEDFLSTSYPALTHPAEPKIGLAGGPVALGSIILPLRGLFFALLNASLRCASLWLFAEMLFEQLPCAVQSLFRKHYRFG